MRHPVPGARTARDAARNARRVAAHRGLIAGIVVQRGDLCRQQAVANFIDPRDQEEGEQ